MDFFSILLTLNLLYKELISTVHIHKAYKQG